jgi:hypothetical protein
MAQMPHMKRREGDEWYCARCNTRWGVDEEPPEQVCIDARGDDRARRYPPLVLKRPLPLTAAVG